MEVPYKSLSERALLGVIREFVTREGTDYGERVYALEEKIAHVLGQIEKGEVRIFYEEETQTCNLVTTEQLHRAAQEEEEEREMEGG